MTPDLCLSLASRDPMGQLTKRKSGYWLPSVKVSGETRVDTATVQECIRAGWLKSTPSRDESGKITYAVTLTPQGAERAGI